MRPPATAVGRCGGRLMLLVVVVVVGWQEGRAS